MDSIDNHLNKEFGCLLRMNDVGHCKAILGMCDSVRPTDPDGAGGLTGDVGYCKAILGVFDSVRPINPDGAG